MPAVGRVLVVGAGIVDPTLACALSRRGVDVEIVELKPEFRIPGAGMILQGTALRALRDIDVVQDLAALGWFDPSCTIRFLDTLGEVVLAPPERNIVGEGYPATLAVRRQAVHEVLSAHVTKVTCQSGWAPRSTVSTTAGTASTQSFLTEAAAVTTWS